MVEENIYHLYNRGINKAPLFFEKRNYDYFLNQFDKYLSEYIDVYSYCLMPNHFHFLVKVKIISNSRNKAEKQNKSQILTPIEKAHRDFFISYAKSINKAYGRSGALFQFKYKRKPIINETNLYRLVAYIHLNPVRANLCNYPEDWEFSSYNSILSEKFTKVKRAEILSWFGDKTNFIEFHKSYRDYQKERDYLFKNSI